MSIYLHPAALSMRILNEFSSNHGLEAVVADGHIRLLPQLPTNENRNPKRLVEYRHKQAIRLRNREAKFEVELS